MTHRHPAMLAEAAKPEPQKRAERVGLMSRVAAWFDRVEAILAEHEADR